MHKHYGQTRKPKPGEIIVTPNDNRLLEMPPIVNNPASLPKWFRLIPKGKSVRRCAGVMDYLSIGVTVPAWTNIYVEPSPDSDSKWNLMMENIPFSQFQFTNEPFPFESTGKCPMSEVRDVQDGYYPKIVNPWLFRTAPGWSTLVLPVMYEPNKNFHVIPAVVNTDFYHNLNCVLNITGNSSFKIEYGTPLMHLIPFKRSEDISKMTFEDDSMYKMYHARGYGNGSLFPIGSTSAAYRRATKDFDAGLESESIKKKSFFRRK
jgi:hypothetical protein